jgi:hypothetical protein
MRQDLLCKTEPVMFLRHWPDSSGTTQKNDVVTQVFVVVVFCGPKKQPLRALGCLLDNICLRLFKYLRYLPD